MESSKQPGWLRALQNHSHEFVIIEEVAVPLQEGDCPAYFGDELALWCHEHGLMARRMERVRFDAIRFGFMSQQDATKFRKACGLPSSV